MYTLLKNILWLANSWYDLLPKSSQNLHVVRILVRVQPSSTTACFMYSSWTSLPRGVTLGGSVLLFWISLASYLVYSAIFFFFVCLKMERAACLNHTYLQTWQDMQKHTKYISTKDTLTNGMLWQYSRKNTSIYCNNIHYIWSWQWENFMKSTYICV